MLEGTGQWGASSLREVNWQTGEITQFLALPAQYFGEGITVFDDKIYQLTWRSQTGFIFNRESFELLKTFTYPTEGWGITHDGRQLIMSDGTSTLYFRDPETLVEIGRLEVYDENGPVVRLNELEFVEGEIWANIWETDFIARISPESGQVLGWIDLTDLLPASMRTGYENVLNGIAYDAENGRIFVTGKWWPALFEIELVEQPGP